MASPARRRFSSYAKSARLLGETWRLVDEMRGATTDESRHETYCNALALAQELRAALSEVLARPVAGIRSPAPTDMTPADRPATHTPDDEDRLEALLLSLAPQVRSARPWYIARLDLVVVGACMLAVMLLALAIMAGSELGNSGFRVTYYRGVNFDSRRASRTEPQAFRDYGAGRPSLLLRRDGWSAKWEGVLHAPNDGGYTFHAQSDDGLRLYVDGVLLVDDWSDHDWTRWKVGQTNLTRGPHPVLIEHYDRRGTAGIKVRWRGGGVPANTILGAPHVTKR